MVEKHWTDRLSDYIDGELGDAERAALESHLARCSSCRTTLEELRQVVTAAASLQDREPANDLFPAILQKIRAGDDAVVVPIARAGTARRFTFSIPQLAAAAIAVMTLSAGAAWLAARPDSPTTPAVAVTAPAEPADAGDMAAEFVSDTRSTYDAAIEGLEQTLAEQRDQLDPETVEVIERNLAVIDTAIAEARAALENDPSNAYLYRHLDNTLNKKIDLLRRATTRRVAT